MDTSSMDNRLFTRGAVEAATKAVNSPGKRLIRGVDKQSGCNVLLMQHKNGQFTVLAEYTVPPQGTPVECQCEPEHSVAKLGHCVDCPGFRPGQPNMLQPDLLRGSTGCPPRHADGSVHDFDWATYTDERMSTGVCRCGLSAIDYDVLVMP